MGSVCADARRKSLLIAGELMKQHDSFCKWLLSSLSSFEMRLQVDKSFPEQVVFPSCLLSRPKRISD
jgi:hypothetical protein